MRTVVLVLLAAALFAVAPLASATLQVEVSRGVALLLPAVDGGFAGSAEFRFSLSVEGDVYAKLIPTAGNPVHDGNAANGSAPTASSNWTDGTGWWVIFSLNEGDRDMAHTYARADGTPTDAMAMPTGREGSFGVTVHAPTDAFLANETYTVHVVLAVRAPGAANESGGTMDEALSFSLDVSRGAGQAPPPEEERDDGAPDAEGDAETVREERRRLPTPVLITGAVVALLLALGILLASRAKRT